MACSGRKPSEGKEELGAVVADFEPEGTDPKVSGHFSKAATQAVLLFGAETWERSEQTCL